MWVLIWPENNLEGTNYPEVYKGMLPMIQDSQSGPAH